MTPPGGLLGNNLGRILDTGNTSSLHQSDAKMYIFGPGQWVPNTQLYPINPELVSGTPLTVDSRTSLKDLFQQHAGKNLDWGACFSERGREASATKAVFEVGTTATGKPNGAKFDVTLEKKQGLFKTNKNLLRAIRSA